MHMYIGIENVGQQNKIREKLSMSQRYRKGRYIPTHNRVKKRVKQKSNDKCHFDIGIFN